MKKAFVALSSLFLLAACSPASPATPGDEKTVSSFEECVAAGHPVMESLPRQCRHGDQNFVEPAEIPAPPVTNERPCTKEYMPVCGEIQVQCITTPCNPVKTTFGNRCEAENAKAANIVEGACVDEAANPEGACLSFDGTWLPETQECEGMGQEQCKTLGGTWNECATACRNDPQAEMCTTQCVLVCQF